MNALKNISLPFKKLGDLIYHEGPLLSLYIDDHTNMFLYRWIDCDDESNHWILTSISSEELAKFYHKKLSLRQYYNCCDGWIIVKIDNSLKIKEISALETIPEDYLPKKNSFYYEPLYTEFSNSWKTLYVNDLGLVSQKKADIYEYFGLKNKNETITSTISSIVNNINLKTYLPTISDINEAAILFRAFNHEVRRKIVEFVLMNPGCTNIDIYIYLKIEQSVVSQHISILKACKVLTSKRYLKSVKFYVNPKKIDSVHQAINALEDKKEMSEKKDKSNVIVVS